ncbi:hypothetical protein [Actinotalea solisilvae]|uniref:hypothetical protein n=1 Tax=Actinotalea solisilvae TaxID=2072922 RepID=UPI0018F1727A|nr:hypothetical protein [Actinotalea solisilvae]
MRGIIQARRGAVVTVILLGLSGAPAAAAAAPAEDAPVEWVVGSDDSFADAVEHAVRRNGAGAVRHGLEALADAAASGADVDFPGLDALAPAAAARVLTDTATAVAAGTALPAAAHDLALATEPAPDEEPPFPFDPDQTYGRVLLHGHAYAQTNWLRRGVSEPDGSVRWTDVVQLRWVTHPGASASRVDYWLTRPKNQTGFFGAARAQTWAFVGDAVVGVGRETPLAYGSAFARYVRNDPATFGAQLWHGTTLTALSPDGNEWSSGYRTIAATCHAYPDRTCTYAP